MHRDVGNEDLSYNKPIITMSLFDSLLPFVIKQLGLHYICTKSYAVLLKFLNSKL